MTDEELGTLLLGSLRAHDKEAPNAESIQTRLRSAPSIATSRRPSRWLPAIAVAACALLVVGGVTMWSGDQDVDRPPAAPSDSPSQRPATRSVTVFLARQDQTGKGHVRLWHLVPRRVTVANTGDPGMDAVRALFALKAPDGLLNWFDTGSRRAAEVNSVKATNGHITVDINRPLPDASLTFDCRRCPDAETVLQQLAWTVSTALESQQPISLTVNGRPARQVMGVPVIQSGLPNDSLIAEADRSFPWYREVCGGRSIVAVTGDGRRIDVPPPGNSQRPTAKVTLQVGDTLQFEITGQCFQQLNAGTDGSSVLTNGAPDPNGESTIVARTPGRAVASVGGGACMPSFTHGTCIGPFVRAGSVAVHVVRP